MYVAPSVRLASVRVFRWQHLSASTATVQRTDRLSVQVRDGRRNLQLLRDAPDVRAELQPIHTHVYNTERVL